MEAFATELKRIQSFCGEAEYKVGFEIAQLNVDENILKFCTIARSRAEIIEFCGFKSSE